MFISILLMYKQNFNFCLLTMISSTRGEMCNNLSYQKSHLINIHAQMCIVIRFFSSKEILCVLKTKYFHDLSYLSL